MENPAQYSFIFPSINASLNALASILLFWGFVLIKQRKLEAHEKVMKAAFLVSAVFLSSYLYYHFNYTSWKFGGQGWVRPFYFVMLISHIILATLNVPFILRILWLGHKKRTQEHAKLARWVWPVWMYVSVTGVLIYFMLYIWFPSPEILEFLAQP